VPTTCSEQLVTFRGGFVADMVVVGWMIDMEFAGFSFEPTPDGRLRVTPAGRLTETQRAFVQRHRDAILSIATYCAAEARRPL
jgi:hypothetical protein